MDADGFTLHPTNMNLRNIIPEIIQIIENEAQGNNIKIEWSIDNNIPSIIADPVRIRQILLNLMCNAVKFTKDGNVMLKVIQISRNENSCHLLFQVKDTGIGISKDKQEYIFEKFTQIDSSLSRQYSGAGLGLSICKKLVTMMGGNIGVISEPGKGSLFWFEIIFPISNE